MPRRPRERSASGWYHVMNRGTDHRDLFATQRDGVDFEHSLAGGVARHSAEVHAYCLMPNHFHLLVHAPDGLASFMRDVTSAYVRRFNARVGRDGPLFRGRYTAIPVDDDAQVIVTAHDVHANPVQDSEHDRWSSERVNRGHASAPVWLTTDFLQGRLGSGSDEGGA